LEIELSQAPREAYKRTSRQALDESRREAWATRVASLALALFISFLMVMCLYTFTTII
jgi:hypothetical protein